MRGRRVARTIGGPPQEAPYVYDERTENTEERSAVPPPAAEPTQPDPTALFDCDDDDEVERRALAVLDRLEARAQAIRCRSDVGPHDRDYAPDGDALYNSWQKQRQLTAHEQRETALRRAAELADEVVAMETFVMGLVHGLVGDAITESDAKVSASIAARESRIAESLAAEAAERQQRREQRQADLEAMKAAEEEAYFASRDPFISQIRRDAAARYEAEREAAAAAEAEEIERLNARLSKWFPETDPADAVDAADDGSASASEQDRPVTNVAADDESAEHGSVQNFEPGDDVPAVVDHAEDFSERQSHLAELRRRVVEESVSADSRSTQRRVARHDTAERLAKLHSDLRAAEEIQVPSIPASQDTGERIRGIDDGSRNGRTAPPRECATFISTATID